MKGNSYIYYKTILVFAILSIVYFYRDLDKKFYQFNYKWSLEQTIKEFGDIDVVDIGFDYIELKRVPPFQEDSFDYNSIYKLHTKNGSLYFKSAKIIQTDSSILLARLNWLNRPPKDYKIEEALLKEVYIPFNDKGDILVQMIGNQKIWMDEGRRLRYLMNDQNDQLSFVGTNSDAYGFKHEGYSSKSLSDLNEKIKILPANIYVLQIFSDSENNDDNILSALDSIIEKILSKNEASSIIIITPFPSLNIQHNERNLRLRDLLVNQAFLSSDTIIMLDAYKIYSEDLNDETFLNDGIGFTIKGYSILAKSLTDVITEISK